jgi:hypothetical protein
VRFAAPAKFDFATSRNTANIYSINRPLVFARLKVSVAFLAAMAAG